jgi:2'-5' RNA ligase
MTTSLIQLILEESGKHTYGCAMLDVDAAPVLKIQDAINPQDVYENTSGEGIKFGLEDRFHVTLLYGLHEEVTVDEVKGKLKGFTFGSITLYNLSKFEKDDYDVLKFDIKYPTKGGAFLSKANKALSELPNTNDYPDYKAHLTIGYLKKGAADKYINKLKGFEYQTIPTGITYSAPSGEETKIEIKTK